MLPQIRCEPRRIEMLVRPLVDQLSRFEVSHGRHSGAHRRCEPGTHEHGRRKARTPDSAKSDLTVFSGSGFLAALGPGMTKIWQSNFVIGFLA
jgi:hypothetical protein